MTVTSPTTPTLPAVTDRPRRTVAFAARVAISVTVLGVLLMLVLPAVTGADWTSAIATLSLVTPWELIGLTALWLAGLWAYCFVMSASLPGLRRSQAFVLNLVGSGVSNLVPVGGAVGVGVTWSMLRQYGFEHRRIGLFTAVTGVWNVLARLALPVAGLGALFLVGAHISDTVLLAGGVGAALCAVVIGLVVAALLSRRTGDWLIKVVTRAGTWLARATKRPAPLGLADELADLRASARELLRTGRVPLVGGMLAYLVLQGVLMWACLAVVGSHLGWAEVTAGYATGRMLTTIVLTPGGTGFAETGAAAVLIALGGDPAVTLAGVLLFSVFTYVCEIPGGALSYLWHLRQMRSGHAGSDAGPDAGCRADGDPHGEGDGVIGPTD